MLFLLAIILVLVAMPRNNSPYARATPADRDMVAIIVVLLVFWYVSRHTFMPFFPFYHIFHPGSHFFFPHHVSIS
jgi:hypothetical protein